MKIYTFTGSEVIEGATVKEYRINDKIIKVLSVGERGRGRKLGLIPVKASDETIHYASLDASKAVLQAENIGNPELPIILVLRSKYGFRGSNEHIIECDGGKYSDSKIQQSIPNITCLTYGICADGDAGRMASGFQYILLIHKPLIIYVNYTGRLYGSPNSYKIVVSERDVKCYTKLDGSNMYEDEI